MYNAELNRRICDKLVEEVADKRILLVGNAMSLFADKTHGELIDSYDFVLRFGRGIPDPKYSAWLGTRFDAWFFGTGRAGTWKNLTHVPWKIFTPSQMRTYEPQHDTHMVPLDMMNGDFEVYKDFMLSSSSAQVLELNRRVNGRHHKKSRCSQGLQAVEFFKNLGLPVTLIGFDFFAGEFNYQFNNRLYPNIPRDQPTTSWHCPLVSQEYKENPHGFSEDGVMTNEEKYIRSCSNVVRVIDMPAIDTEQATSLAQELRGIY